jgi:hypothetical protein
VLDIAGFGMKNVSQSLTKWHFLLQKVTAHAQKLSEFLLIVLIYELLKSTLNDFQMSPVSQTVNHTVRSQCNLQITAQTNLSNLCFA